MHVIQEARIVSPREEFFNEPEYFRVFFGGKVMDWALLKSRLAQIEKSLVLWSVIEGYFGFLLYLRYSEGSKTRKSCPCKILLGMGDSTEG